MRCSHARKIMAQKESQGIAPRDERALSDHLSICPGCAKLEDELERTWNALGYHPKVEPSPDFLPRLRAKLKAEDAVPRPGRIWRLDLHWQWVALAACVLLVAVVISRNGHIRDDSLPQDQGAKVVANHDRWDEQFLEDLERALQHSDADYLSTYDSWSDSLREAASIVPPKAGPAERAKRKEIS